MKRLAKKLFVLFLGVALVSSTLLVYFTYFTQAKTIPRKSYSKKFLFKTQGVAYQYLLINNDNQIIYPVYNGPSIKEWRIFNPKTKRSRIIPFLETTSIYGNYGVFIDNGTSQDTLYLYNIKTGNKTIITNGDLYCADISKNYIVYSTHNSEFGYGDASGAIYVYNRKTKKTKRLIEESYPTCPIISGKRITWYSRTNSSIYLMDITKTRPRRISKTQSDRAYNICGLNSSYALYWSHKDSTYRFYLYNIAKRKTTKIRITSNSIGNYQPQLIGNSVFWREMKTIGVEPNIDNQTAIYYFSIIKKRIYRLVTSSKYDYFFNRVNKGNIFIWVRVLKSKYGPDGMGYVYKITIK